MAHALGLAAVPNIALRLTRFGELSMWKGCASANAARNGVFAALLAKRGMTGPAPLFEGEKGFFDQVTGAFGLGPLGNPFKILESSIKFYPAEFLGQTAIEAALALREQISSIDEITGVDIDTFDACVKGIAEGPEKWKPATRETADHSLPYCVAVALADGAVTSRSFSAERISDPKLYELMQKIRVHSNADLSAQYPKVMPNEIRIQIASGKVIERRVSYAHGHPKNPLTNAEVETKFRGLASAFLPEKTMKEILAQVWDLEKVQSLEPLLPTLNLGADKA
jgi:2-methylcitrate dehydratase